MPKKQPVFTYDQFLAMLDEAPNTKTVNGVVIVAMGQVAKKQLSELLYANLLIQAGHKIYQNF